MNNLDGHSTSREELGCLRKMRRAAVQYCLDNDVGNTVGCSSNSAFDADGAAVGNDDGIHRALRTQLVPHDSQTSYNSSNLGVGGILAYV